MGSGEEEVLDHDHGFFVAEFEHSTYLFDNDTDWDNSSNAPQALGSSLGGGTGLRTPKQEPMSPIGVPERIPESGSPTHELSRVESSSPRSAKVEAFYSELDMGFAAALENLSNPTGSGYIANNTVNLDYFQFSTNRSRRSNELYSTPNARPRAATMTAMQGYSSRGNRTSNAVSYSDPRPYFESKSALPYNDRGDAGYIPPEVDLPSYQELMNPIARGVDINTRFSSAEEANGSCRKSFDIPPDPTIPHAIEQKRAIVRTLCKAMKSVDLAEDNPGMVRPFAERKYSDTRIEIACWNILEFCIERHTTGPLLAAYDVKPKHSGDFPTFRQRIERIIEGLLKTICKHLLDPFYLLTFIDDPVGCQKRVVANKKLNKRKGEVMIAGKHALGHTRANSIASGSVSGYIDCDDPFAQSSPLQTPRSGRTRTGILNADGEVMTPDSVNRRAMSAMTLSSPAISSSVPDEIFQQGLVSGTSSFHATPDLRQMNRSYASSPINYRGAYMALTDPSFRRPLSRMIPPRRLAAPTSQSLSEPSTAPATPPNRSKPSTGTSSHRRKRSGSDSDDSEYLPPSVKRAQR
ncbi:hypothetical protein VTN02DRAFT_1066 [Thermoascus thermophilus]